MCGKCGCHEESSAIEIDLNTSLYASNNTIARENRIRFEAHNTFCINLLSGPGSGKTTFLVKTIEDLKRDYSIAVIEGDQQTDNDAQRIRSTGIPAIQINTGPICHLEANMIRDAMDSMKNKLPDLLFVENVGNLVCPASFDLGEKTKTVLLSITEGEDKPIKYPDMFRRADVIIINKIDLLPYLDFDLNRCMEYIERVNPTALVFITSAKTGEGMQQWYEFLATSHEYMAGVPA